MELFIRVNVKLSNKKTPETKIPQKYTYKNSFKYISFSVLQMSVITFQKLLCELYQVCQLQSNLPHLQCYFGLENH